MTLRGLFDWLLPGDDQFFAMLEQHARGLDEAALALVAFVDRSLSPQDSLDGIHRLERRGDDLVVAMAQALDKTFVTPIDREDLHSLAMYLDSAIDQLYRATASFVRYDVMEFTPAMRELVQLCAQAARSLKEAVPYIRSGQLHRLTPACKQIDELEKRGDAVYRAELAALFGNRAINAKDLLRQKAVLDALEAALDSCQDAADLLTRVAVKHS